MISLTYVSAASVDETERANELQAIHSISVARNTSLSITGLLIASPSFFAQVLEGPEANVEAVMTSIVQDERHRDVVVFRRENAKERQFANWQMALYDTAGFGATTVDPLLAALHRQKDPQAIKRYNRFITSVAMNGSELRA